MRTSIILLVLLGLLPVAPLPATATLTVIEVTVDRATAWRTRSKLGRIKANGTFRGVGGPFDKTQIVVTVTDGQDLHESGTFTSCREYPSGVVRCQNDDRTARLRYIPDRTEPDLYRYKLDYRRRDITRPQVAPLQIEFDYAGGAATAAAKNEPCQVLNAKLVCKGTSAPVETCSDGVQNQDETDIDCGGTVCGVCAPGLMCNVDGDCGPAAGCIVGICLEGNTPIGSITADINRGGNPTGSDRGVESPAGNLVADIQQWATSSNGAEVAFMNPGGVRSDLRFAESGGEGDGVVTFGEAFTLQPFGNILVTFPMTGAQIVSVLEDQCQPASASHPFLHLGVSDGFTYDLAKTIVAGDCTSITVSNVKLHGVALDPAATYFVTASNFLADGGDNFATFATIDPATRIDGGRDLEALVGYLGAFSPVAPPSTDRVNEFDPPLDCAGAGGATMLGACWFFGLAGQSCDNVCADKGLVYDTATRDVAGSGGTAASCNLVMDAIGAPVPVRAFGDNRSGVASGCLYCCNPAVADGGGCPAASGCPSVGRIRVETPDTTADASASIHRRACACQ